jgi:hypothetical protein
MTSIYQITFTFTPDDEHVNGEGFVTVFANNDDVARQIVHDMMGDAKDLMILEIQKIADVPDTVPHSAHDTLQ